MIEKNINYYIEKFALNFLNKIKDKKVHLISHYDTDGITSAAIMSKTLERLNLQFSSRIIKHLDEKEILYFPKGKLIVLLDLGSGSLEQLAKIEHEIIIIDHHETIGNPSSNILLLNPHIIFSEELCSAELSYLVSKQISLENKDLAHLAILGMVGDTLEKEINKTRNSIIKEANVHMKKGVLIYPSTRPLDKALEYNSRPFISGVTGNPQGVYELLKEAGIEKIGKNFKSLIDLNAQEMKNLATAIMLRVSAKDYSEYIGNLYLLKFLNRIEDARELSAIINACSRMGNPETSLMLCLGNTSARKKAERIYVKYRQNIISGLRYINEKGFIREGKHYVILNAKNNVKDSIIGTLASILSFSSVYKEGTIIVAMAYNENKIKVSARMAGKNPKPSRNLKQLMESITSALGRGESGGHKRAAGCIIRIEDEEKFIKLLQKELDIEMIKI